jgi:cobalamin biosynthesis Mg chelatase CobN
VQETLDFKCVCGDSGPANVEKYIMTVPFHVCIADFDQCIAANERDALAQDKCKQQRENNCPTTNATADSASTTTSSASSTAAATVSETAATTANKEQGSAATSTSSSSPASTTTANAAVLLAQEYSTGLMATALFAALRLAL